VTGHPSALVLEGFANGTTGLDFGSLPAHLESCRECQRQLEQAREARAEFGKYILPKTREQVVARSRFRWWSLAPVALVPALGLALVMLVPRPQVDREIRAKGEAAFTTFAERDGAISPVVDGSLLKAGDRLRFALDNPKLPYLLIVSVDAADHRSVYVPFNGRESVEIDPTQRFVSPGSIKLDPVAGPERVFVLLSRTPLPADDVLRQLRTIHGGQAIRETHRLNVEAETQLSLFWENTGNE
jgi:hypothetical protein